MFAGHTLQWYIFRRLVGMMAVFAVAIAALAVLIDFTEMTNRAGNLSEYTVGLGLMISAIRAPFYVLGALPFVMLFATIATLIALNRRFELVVARSAGMSAWQFLAPTWGAAIAIGIVSVAVLSPLAASGFSAAEAIEGSWSGSPASRALPDEEPWLRQNRVDGGTVLIGAQRVTNDEVLLREAVFLEISAGGSIIARHDAESARLDDGQWVLEDVTTSLADQRPIWRDTIVIATALNEAVIREALVPAEMVPVYALPAQIEAARSFGVPAHPFRMQFHSLVALPALLVAMTLVAATVSLRFVRSGQSTPMIVGGIAAGFVLYVLTALAKSFGSAGIIPPPLAAWLPVLCGMLFGTAYLLHREDG
ncbi:MULTISPECIES: LptF/LptG family permease [unclassified Roseitalea]|uniref:LptF/LptG family permease n=1 Tax=unclassified Roseitalea TaxID=2639107 RepID=UPI00273D76F2|nr:MULTISPECIES: LptF/LptG family permease [unclassified Roseitalea]